MRWASFVGRLCVAVVVLPVLAGCYNLVPVAGVQPAPGAKLSLVLNDEGRMNTAQQVGPYTVRIEGELVQASESNYVVAVTDVVDIRGAHSKWTGETVPLPRRYVMTTYQKEFSTPKTVLLLGAVAGAFVAMVASFNLFGFGRGSGNGEPPPGNEQ
ncbi:MAG TPA: hypothetical protein VJ755_05435 [Gemmatimonadales bacterium]|nr:hypothetical protein [Gemmatimonadales bacterium]